MATKRQQLMDLLEEGEWNSIDLSKALSLEEREIFTHIEHVKKSLKGRKLVIDPYQCLSCNYLFKKRNRLDRPGRCPQCKGSHIRMALFSIR